jgi:hypothetical protein
VTAELTASSAEALDDELADAVRRGDAGAITALAEGYGASLPAPERRRRGAFATPPALAATLARHALPAPVRTVVDPACGPGALLRAAFARLLALGSDPRAAFAALHGADADPVAAALCRAVLAVDARDAGLDERLDRLVAELEGRIVVGDALLGPVPARPSVAGVPAGRKGTGREGLDWARALPEVLAVPGAVPDPVTGWRGGFDAVVLNPPWERLKVAVRDWAGNPPAHLRAEQAGAARAVREGGRHPLTGTGELNAFLPFLETGWRLLSSSGRLAAVVPGGVVSDRSSSGLLRAWLEADALEVVRVLAPDRPIFDGVSARVGATVLVLRSGPTAPPPAVARGASVATRLADADGWAPAWRATAASVALVNPNTRTLPAFGSAAEAELVERVHRRVPVLVRRSPDGVLDDPWQLRLVTPLHMTRDASSFAAAPAPGLLPLWEAKHAGLLDHRGGGTPSPRYWVPRELVERRFAGLVDRGWLAGYRNVTTTAAARTLLPAPLPVVGVGNSLPLVSAPRLPLLLAALASLPVDFLARCRHAGANLNFFKLEQVPVPPPSAYDAPAPWEPSVRLEQWVLTRFARAVAWTPELSALAAELRSLDVEVPADLAPASPSVRAQAFAELDAAHAVLLGMTRADVELVLSTFPELRRRDKSASGTFATGNRVLTAYDALCDDQGSFRDHS